MLQSWRWYGPEDPVTLRHVRQAGAAGIVTALHHIYDGRAWSLDDVLAHKALVEKEGLTWTVCESIPVSTAIKIRDGASRAAIDAWKASLVSLGRAGIPVVCFNFMPVLDWTRTDLRFEVASTGLALRFDMVDFAAYDVFVLKRPLAEGDYPADILQAAKRRFASFRPGFAEELEFNIISGLPGGEGKHDRAGLLAEIGKYADVDAAALRANLIAFLAEIAPVAEDVGVKLSIHPDDPPFSLLGLPRVVSCASDVRALFDAVPNPANGMVICTGSYGVREDNDIVAMVEEFGPRVHFAHLRNVQREGSSGSFHESDHLDGSVDMIAVVDALLKEEAARRANGHALPQIPMRPDHGHLLIDDQHKPTNPGYSCIGRLRGLAELRGVMQALEYASWNGSRPL
ncbi:mannonate dehydratase [Bosea sp. (in: a-proteobacteria)]|uniref:mannonate dehydratase n=1 Tax=Bosea sp. (in: a-proteobacteria) TaxID=1871050 RepID=UPI00262CD3E9|nr:mannonate dehydratase [Bosea sp. (in: a-proteobacteria)]MCO5090335.1 mannonate dehydratase [Bosea sp. (in: a-proteobacteria)]